MPYDLHTHTTSSDGTLPPGVLVERSRERGLEVVAVTDHDTTEAIPEAQAAGRRLDVRVIAGMEISSEIDGQNLHVLGYFPGDGDGEALLRYRLARRAERIERIREIIRRLRAIGIAIDEPEVVGDDGHGLDAGQVGRPHVARALLKRGHVSSVREAFDRYLGRGGLAFVEYPKLGSAEAIDLVRRAGGVACAAHPGLDGLDASLPALKEQGLAGVEAFHPDHDERAIAAYLEHARRLDLLVTGGSDFHGERKGEGGALGGVTLPREHYARFLAALERVAP